MKKFYALIVVCLGFAQQGFSQNYYWIGTGGNSNWSNPGNWSASSGGPAAATYPDNTAHNVIFDINASVTLDVADVDVSTLSVTGATAVNVSITASGGGTNIIRANSTSTITPGISINSGKRLSNIATGNTVFVFEFVPNGQGVVNGEWNFSTSSAFDESYFVFSTNTGETTRLNVNNGGIISTSASGFLHPNDVTGHEYLRFNAGSTLKLSDIRPIVPTATYDVASTILIDGITANSPSFEEATLGNVTYDCAGQTSDLISLGLLNNVIKGDLKILNTNNNDLALVWNGVSSNLVLGFTVEGNLEISGTSSVILSQVDATNKTVNVAVFGDLVAGGTSLDLQTNSNNGIQATNLFIKGNIEHTAGTFKVSSTATYQAHTLFNIEFSGTIPQTISSVSGGITNSTNEVTFKLNNAAGVTLLSPFTVGRMNFASGNLTTTSANVLTINNISGAGPVINNPSNASYINGPVRRSTNTASAYVLPTGAGSLYRPATVVPAGTSASTYEATYFNSGSGDNSVALILKGIATNYYWEVNRVGSGADAAVQLSIPGAVSGAQSTDGLVVAKYNGTDWVNAKGLTGTMVTPGDATSGTVTSEVQTTFSLFTIGYASQAVLPTLLVSFEGKKASKQSVELKWKITDNSAPSTFQVMRSEDGVNYVNIGSVQGLEGKLNYAFTDNSILAGNNYYRLKMLDKDGSITYSTIIVISNGAKGIFVSTMMPTLVRDRARLNITSSVKGNMQLVVTDIKGRIVQNQIFSINSGNQDIWLNASRLPAGMFQVTAYINGEKTPAVRFIKL